MTGKNHAGQMIDHLGNGRLQERSTDQPLFDLDITYKVQTEAGGIAQVVGMARNFAAGEGLVVVLGDNIFEHAQTEVLTDWGTTADRALIFVTEVSDPENFGVVVYGENGSVEDIVEKAGVVDMRYAAPPSNDAVVGLYCYPPDVFDRVDSLETSSPRRARDHGRQPLVRRGGPPRRAQARGLVGGRRQALAALRRDRPADRRDGREQVIDGVQVIPLSRWEDERGWLYELRRESAMPQPTRQTNISFSRAGVIRGLHFHERGQSDLFTCLHRQRPRRRARPRDAARRCPTTSATTTRSRSRSPATTRTASRR